MGRDIYILKGMINSFQTSTLHLLTPCWFVANVFWGKIQLPQLLVSLLLYLPGEIHLSNLSNHWLIMLICWCWVAKNKTTLLKLLVCILLIVNYLYLCIFVEVVLICWWCVARNNPIACIHSFWLRGVQQHNHVVLKTHVAKHNHVVTNSHVVIFGGNFKPFFTLFMGFFTNIGETGLLVLDSVFVNQNNCKYWDGNAVQILVELWSPLMWNLVLQ